ncbi:hypothetical protein BH18ACT4_BH18ACT4_04770 [soil metagenome]
MILHHQQAIELSELAVRRAPDARVIALASRMAADRSGEIERMRTMLADLGRGAEAKTSTT